MRIALTTALMMVAALALADEPTSPETKTEATTEAAADNAAAQPAQTETTAKADTAPEEKKFRPPAGYKPKRVNGEQVWCTKTVILGSKFPKEDCRTEAQLREIVRSRATMREELGRGRSCSGAGCAIN
ncbi:MAG TPA: hypothetical protein VFO35_21150 [Steroidobacteraceae bacterium]|nr:hypothetical protein [Steroidobacteraceae bacterium]